MNKKQIFTVLIMSILIIFSFYLRSIIGVLELVFVLILYGLFFYFFHYIWSKIRKKEILKPVKFFEVFLYRASISLVITVSVLGSFTLYQNKYFPAPMPQITMSNGEKTVIFQAMSHIGIKSFYEKVVMDIKQAKNKGFVYYFEGVKPGSKENTEAFNEAIGIKFNKDLYKNLSKLYGIVNQNNEDFIGLVNDKDFNIDLDINEIMDFYREINKDSKKIEAKKPPVDFNKEIIELLSTLNQRELKILVYINKSIMNFIIKNHTITDFIKNNFGNKDLFKVILDKRNEVLSSEILESSHKKIFITYGLLHFDGVFKLLKENDKNWKITNKEIFYPIR